MKGYFYLITDTPIDYVIGKVINGSPFIFGKALSQWFTVQKSLSLETDLVQWYSSLYNHGELATVKNSSAFFKVTILFYKPISHHSPMSFGHVYPCTHAKENHGTNYNWPTYWEVEEKSLHFQEKWSVAIREQRPSGQVLQFAWCRSPSSNWLFRKSSDCALYSHN